MNIYVGNFGLQTSEDELRTTFEQFGRVLSINLIKDKFTGESRGFAFVEMPNLQEARAAIQGMDGKELGNRTVIVNEARPKTDAGGGNRNSFSNNRRGGRF